MTVCTVDYWVDCLLFWLWLLSAERLFLPFWNRQPPPRSPMSYPQGYLYQPPGSLALYSCPAYGASALAAPRNEDLARSSSGSAFSPYPGSAAFSASAGAGFSSPLSYSTDPTTGFPSYMVKYLQFSCTIRTRASEMRRCVKVVQCAHSVGTERD